MWYSRTRSRYASLKLHLTCRLWVLERAGVTGRGWGLGDTRPLGGWVRAEAQLLASGRAMHIARWLAGEPKPPKEPCPMVEGGQGHVGAEPASSLVTMFSGGPEVVSPIMRQGHGSVRRQSTLITGAVPSIAPHFWLDVAHERVQQEGRYVGQWIG